MTAATRIQCDRAARHAFWAFRWRVWRRELTLWAIITIALALAFLIALAIALKLSEKPPQPAVWNGIQWTCPAGTSIWADEDLARAGRDSAFCVQDANDDLEDGDEVEIGTWGESQS